MVEQKGAGQGFASVGESYSYFRLVGYGERLRQLDALNRNPRSLIQMEGSYGGGEGLSRGLLGGRPSFIRDTRLPAKFAHGVVDSTVDAPRAIGEVPRSLRVLVGGISANFGGSNELVSLLRRTAIVVDGGIQLDRGDDGYSEREEQFDNPVHTESLASEQIQFRNSAKAYLSVMLFLTGWAALISSLCGVATLVSRRFDWRVGIAVTLVGLFGYALIHTASTLAL